MTARLFDAFFDDAAIFPPGQAPMPTAIRAHIDHRRSWYSSMIGPFVCPLSRMHEAQQELAGDQLDVSVLLPDDAGSLADAVAAAVRLDFVAPHSIEFIFAGSRAPDIARCVERWSDLALSWFAEVPVGEVSRATARELRDLGVGLKLRTGGTVASSFPTAEALAGAIQAAVEAGVAFKCTAGLHRAVRHTDPRTGFVHHGFLNVLLATQAATQGADLVPTLQCEDGGELCGRLDDLEDEAIAARRLFLSFGTCSIDEPLADLVELGLVTR